MQTSSIFSILEKSRIDSQMVGNSEIIRVLSFCVISSKRQFTLHFSLRIVDKNAWSGLGVICPLGSLDRLVRDDRLDVREH